MFTNVNTQDLRIIAVDEIAIHKEQKYATVFINYETRQVFAVVKGKTQKAVESVFQMLVDRGLQDQIIAVACDMNAAYPNVVEKFLPKAEIVFDQFHVIQGSSSKTPVAKPAGTKMFCSAFLNDARMCCFFANAIVKY